MKTFTSLEISIMCGLDDLAHNRLLTPCKGRRGEYVRVPNYGKRNKNEKCYCAILKKLGVKR